MPLTFQAILVNGVLRPLTPVPLQEGEIVTVTISRSADDDWLDIEYSDSCRAEVDPAAKPNPQDK